MSDVTSRLMRPLEDAPQLIELFETVFGHTVTPHMWAWKYLPPWTDQHYCWVGIEDEGVVGYVGTVPLRGVVHGEEVPFFQLADIMVHPDHRRKHDYFDLGTKAILDEIGNAHPRRMMYGFSNHRAFLWLKKIGLTGLVERAHFRYVRGEPGGADSGYTFEDWAWKDPRVDALWAEIGGRIAVGLIRDSEYLGWRYGSHPVHNYRLVGVSRDGAPLGWAVVGNDGLGKPGRPTEAPVVDLLVPEETARGVFDGLAAHIGHPLQTWLPTRWAPGFEDTKDSGTYVYHFIRDSAVATEELQERLFYTMGDVDWW